MIIDRGSSVEHVCPECGYCQINASDSMLYCRVTGKLVWTGGSCVGWVDRKAKIKEGAKDV